MPGPSNDTTATPAHIGAKVPVQTKQRLLEIAHEETIPGRANVTESDLIRLAVQNLINQYEQDPERFNPREEGTLSSLRNGGSP